MGLACGCRGATKLRFRTGRHHLRASSRLSAKSLASPPSTGSARPMQWCSERSPRLHSTSSCPSSCRLICSWTGQKRSRSASLVANNQLEKRKCKSFTLPPLQQQHRLASFGALQIALERQRQAQLEGDRLRRSLLLDIFRAAPRFSRFLSIPLDDSAGIRGWRCSNTHSNGTPSFGMAATFGPTFGSPMYSTAGSISLTSRRWNFPESELEKFELLPGDILLNEGQSTELVGRSAIYRGEIPGCCFQKTLIRFRCKPGLLPEFAHAFFQHCLYTGQFASMVVQTTSMAHLTAVRFKEFRIPVPPIGEQQQLIDVTRALKTATTAMIERGSALSALGHTFASEVFRTY